MLYAYGLCSRNTCKTAVVWNRKRENAVSELRLVLREQVAHHYRNNVLIRSTTYLSLCLVTSTTCAMICWMSFGSNAMLPTTRTHSPCCTNFSLKHTPHCQRHVKRHHIQWNHSFILLLVFREVPSKTKSSPRLKLWPSQLWTVVCSAGRQMKADNWEQRLPRLFKVTLLRKKVNFHLCLTYKIRVID